MLESSLSYYEVKKGSIFGPWSLEPKLRSTLTVCSPCNSFQRGWEAFNFESVECNLVGTLHFETSILFRKCYFYLPESLQGWGSRLFKKYLRNTSGSRKEVWSSRFLFSRQLLLLKRK